MDTFNQRNKMKFFKKNLTEGSLLNEEPELLTNEHELLAKKHENAKLMQKDKLGQIFSRLNKAEGNALHKSYKRQ